MIVSELTLSRLDCNALRVTDAYSIHRVVYSLFPKTGDEPRNFLFVDKGGAFNNRKILILSEKEPILPEHGSLRMKRLPDAFLNEDLYGFEVTMNPVKRDNKTGRINPIRGDEALTEWFMGKSRTYGFIVEKHSLTVGNTNVLRFKKDGKEVTFGKATFKGKLQVVDRSLFIQSFMYGLGRAKGFGFGLLQIIPLKKTSLDA